MSIKRISLIVAAVSLAFLNSYSQSTWLIGNKEFSVDTLYMATVGPGTTEIELRLEETGSQNPVVNNVFYTVTDLANPYVEMRAAKGGNHIRQLEVVPEIAERMNKAGERYFAGVNADFFNMSYPFSTCGSCVAGGYLTNFGSDYWAHIIFDDKGLPTLAEYVSLQHRGELNLVDGGVHSFGINVSRGQDDLILYSPQWCSEGRDAGYTGTNQWGTEIQVRPVGENVLVGDVLQLEVIDSPQSGVGNMAIPADGYVLSAHGTSQTVIANLKKGDKITASVNFTAEGNKIKVKEMLGGCPIILRNGEIRPTSNMIDHLKNIEPRTAVGHNEDKSKLYMAVVDGRNAGGSTGVTQTELAAIMRCIGCSDAMNFDGGGSSTMYVDGIGIKNVPSSSSLDQRPEGTPRTVVNALFAVAVAPVDNVVASIEIREKKVSLTAGETFTPVVYGYNQYGVMVSSDLSGFTIKVPEQIGQVNGNRLTASDGKYSGLLTADYNGMQYSVPISVNGGGEYITTGINEITTDADTSVEYYQLNGVRTSSPQPGQVTVTRRGNTVTKEITR